MDTLFNGDDEDQDSDESGIFNQDEFDNEPVTEETSGDEFVESLVTPEVQEAADEEQSTDYMLDVDQRLEVAGYYRELCRTSLFTQSTPAARIVEREHRKFIRGRLEELLSIRPEAPPVAAPVSQFSDVEVAAIKILIASMRQKGMIPDAPPPVTAPRRAPTPPPAAPPVKQPARPAPAVQRVRQAVTPQAAVTAAPAPRAAQQRPSAPAKKKPGRPPVAVQMEQKKVVMKSDGTKVITTAQRIQRPAGMVPFPDSPEAMTAATHTLSAQQAAKIEKNARTTLQK